MKLKFKILIFHIVLANFLIAQPIQGFLLNKGFDVKKRELDFTVGSLFMVYHFTLGINSKLNFQTGMYFNGDLSFPFQFNYRFSNFKNLSHLASINFTPSLYETSEYYFAKMEYSVEKKVRNSNYRAHLGYSTNWGWHVFTFQFLVGASVDSELANRLGWVYEGRILRANSPYLGFSSDINLGSPHWFFKNEIYLNQLKSTVDKLGFLLTNASLSMRYGWFGMDAGAIHPIMFNNSANGPFKKVWPTVNFNFRINKGKD